MGTISSRDEKSVAESPETIKTLTGTIWFPTTLAQAFMPSLRISFYIGALLSIVATFLSALRGPVHSE